MNKKLSVILLFNVVFVWGIYLGMTDGFLKSLFQLVPLNAGIVISMWVRRDK